MKRSEMELIIRDKLVKQKHLFETYKKGDYSFQMLVDNLCGRVLTAVEEAGMLPVDSMADQILLDNNYLADWESED